MNEGNIGFTDFPDICSCNRYLLAIYCMPGTVLASLFGNVRFEDFNFLSTLPCQTGADEFKSPQKRIPTTFHSFYL